MVLVSVSDDDAPDFFPSCPLNRKYRDDEVDPHHFFLGEHETGIDDDDIVLVFHNHHILTDFT